jgi:hypothetical protein
MKALSIRQPWAWAIIHAGKDIENRNWSTSYRGPILIHAAKGMTLAEYDGFMAFVAERFPGKRLPLHFPLPEEMERGGIVGKARIGNCVSSSPSPWFFGPYGFVLADAEPLPFRPLKGALGFFDVPEAPR